MVLQQSMEHVSIVYIGVNVIYTAISGSYTIVRGYSSLQEISLAVFPI